MRVTVGITAFAVIMLVVYNVLDNVFSEKEFSTGDYDSYYYLTLDETEKQAYTAVKEKIYEFPKTIETPVLSTSQLEDVLNALVCDDPMMFMMSNCKLIMQGSRAFFTPVYCMDSDEYENYKDGIEQKIDSIASRIPEDDFEAELFCHDYIINNCEYSDTDDTLESTVAGVFIDGRAKCSGYAKAFKLLLNRAGIDSVLVTGEATDRNGETQNHMWNAVKIGDSWCYTDPTWDDPLTEDGSSICRHIYFNMTEEMLRKTHDKFSFDEDCDNASIYYYIIYNAYFTDCDASLINAVSSLIADAADKGENKIEFMLASESLASQVQKYLFDEERIYRVLETAALKTGLQLSTDTVKYSANIDERIITIIFDTEG